MARPSVRPERHDHVGLELIDHRARRRCDHLQRLRGETPVAEIQTRDVVHPQLGHGLVEFLQTDGTQLASRRGRRISDLASFALRE